MKTLQDLFLNELADIYDAERRIAKALPKMATYGCLYEWANLLGKKKAATLLQEILNEEGATNKELTALARSSSNEDAMAEAGK